jgi:hypothetical protein
VSGAGPPATGQAEVRAALVVFFTTWNQSHFEPRGLLFGDHHWVVEWTLHATVAGPLVPEAPTTEVTGKVVSIDGVDVVRVSNGLVTRKDSYIDALTLQAQLGSAELEGLFLVPTR